MCLQIWSIDHLQRIIWGYSVKVHIAEPHLGPTESESLWVGLGDPYFYQMAQVILRHKKVQEQLLKVMHERSSLDFLFPGR